MTVLSFLSLVFSSFLRLKALDLGADGIIDITFDTRGTDTWGTNCWESVQASGIAVKFK